MPQLWAIRLEKQINCFKVFWIQNGFERFQVPALRKLCEHAWAWSIEIGTHESYVSRSWYRCGGIFIKISASASPCAASSTVQNIKSQIFYTRITRSPWKRYGKKKRRKTISWMLLPPTILRFHSSQDGILWPSAGHVSKYWVETDGGRGVLTHQPKNGVRPKYSVDQFNSELTAFAGKMSGKPKARAI